LFNHVETRLT